MTTPKGVAREFYDDAIRQRDAAIARACVAEDRLADLVKELAALKRHDIAAPFAGPIPSRDPGDALGPHTRWAIEESAGGDAELQLRLTSSALMLVATEKGDYPDADALDRHVASLIAAGDTA